VSELIIHYA